MDELSKGSASIPRRGLLGVTTGSLAGIALAPYLFGAAVDRALAAGPGSLRQGHPRIWITPPEAVAIRERIATIPMVADWYAVTANRARGYLAAAPSTYNVVGGRLLTVSRQVRNRVLELAGTYALDGNEEFAERAWVELEAAAAFPDWHPEHFLDTAELAHAFALGYDWLYDYLTPERRAVVRHALVNFGLVPGLAAYQNQDGWTTTTSNWSLVCNSGLGMGALAIIDEEPEPATQVLDHALRSVRCGISAYAPDGGYIEAGYWWYGTRYLVALLSALQSATETPSDLLDSPGVAGTGRFPIQFTGPIGQIFNYSDSNLVEKYSAEMFWLGATYDDPAVTRIAATRPSGDAAVRHLMWYRPTPADDGHPFRAIPRDRRFQAIDVATFRSAWEDSRAVFTGFKGGDVAASHADHDLGTFVLDALGVRWAEDLGPDDYNLPGYFDMAAQRWTYYRKRAEGQNTLVVAPGHGPDQAIGAQGRIVHFETGDAEARVVADLTEAYAPVGVTSWRRGVVLGNHRRTVLVQDELLAEGSVPVHWFMHTTAAIELLDARTAMLSRSGMRLLARIVAPGVPARFSVDPAAPMPTSPNPDGQDPNDGISKLSIHLPAVDSLRLGVEFTPLRPWEQAAAAPRALTPLDAWRRPRDSDARLAGLTLDGVALDAFTPEVFTYDLVDLIAGTDLPALPIVAATGTAGTRVTVDQVHTLPGSATVTVAKPGSVTTTYQVHLDWRVVPAFDVAWDFRDQQGKQAVAASDGTLATWGLTGEVEASDPAWQGVVDGTGAEVQVPAVTGKQVITCATDAVDLSAGFELETWIRQRVRTNLGRIFVRNDVQLWINLTGQLHIQAFADDGSRCDVQVVEAMPLDEWVHIGIRHRKLDDGTRAFDVLLNGVECTYSQRQSIGAATRLAAPTSPLYLGNNSGLNRGMNTLIGYFALRQHSLPLDRWANGLF